MTSDPLDAPLAWGVGIEDTNIGWPLGKDGEGLDEYELTEHYRRWRDDLDLIAETGASLVRYGLPWYRLNPAPGRWEWEWADQVIGHAVDELGLDLVLDLVHYGTPAWLAGSFTDPGYPAAVAEFAGAVAARYAGRVRQFTPLNEPLVTASFTGERGIWPPFELGDDGWARVVVNVADGIQRAARAIRAAQPEAAIVHVEATHVWSTRDPALREHLAHLEERNFLPTDLVLGRVEPDHPLHGWLLGQGIPAARLEAIRAAAIVPDRIGLNYYPDLSCRELVDVDGSIVGVAHDGGALGLRSVVEGFHDRYGLPILISETGIEGEPELLIHWLRDAATEVESLRAEGRPVVGLTWWPLFDFVDWSWGSDGAVVEEFWARDGDRVAPIVPPPKSDGIDAYFRRMGLWNLRSTADGIERVRTPAADVFARLGREAGARVQPTAVEP